MLDPQVLLEAVTDNRGTITDFVYRELNQATCDYLGLAREDLLGHGLLELTPGVAGSGLFAQYLQCLDTGEPVIMDDFTYDNEILADTRRYDLRATRVTATLINLTWRDVTDRFRVTRLLAEAREMQRKSDTRWRRLVDNSGIGMATCTPDGIFQTVNPALCAFFGYDAETLRTKTWQDLTAPDYREVDVKYAEEVLAGRSESYRMTKQFVHADGHLIWGDLSVSCLRTSGGEVESFIAQVIDVTTEVHALQRLAAQDERNRSSWSVSRSRVSASPRSYAVQWPTSPRSFRVTSTDRFGCPPAICRPKNWPATVSTTGGSTRITSSSISSTYPGTESVPHCSRCRYTTCSVPIRCPCGLC